MNKNKYILVSVLLVVAVLLGGVLIAKNGRRSTKVQQNQENITQQQDSYNVAPSQNPYNTFPQYAEPADPVEVGFIESDLELTIGQERTSTVSFPVLPSPAPTALTLVLSFDPTQIEVNNIQPGNLWTGENILEKEIDNENGSVRFSMGQGFSDEVTGNTQIAEITFTTKGSQGADLKIAEGSEYASVEEKRLIPMQGLPLSISVK